MKKMEKKQQSFRRWNYGQKNRRSKKSECQMHMGSGVGKWIQTRNEAFQTLNTRKALEMVVTHSPKEGQEAKCWNKIFIWKYILEVVTFPGILWCTNRTYLLEKMNHEHSKHREDWGRGDTLLKIVRLS